MKHLFLVLAVVGSCSLVLADDTGPKHDGVWKPVFGTLGGMKLPRTTLEAITLKLNGEKYEVTFKGQAESDQGTCTLDPSTTPKRMTLKGTAGASRDKTILAIYELVDADTLQVCYDLSGQEFPKKFEAPSGTLYLATYRRQKE